MSPSHADARAGDASRRAGPLTASDPERAGLLRIRGRLRGAGGDLDADGLAALPLADQIDDVSAYARGVTGRGVRLAALIARFEPRPEARYLNLVANAGRFRASLFRAAVEELGIVVYARDGRPLAREQGGPFELVLPGFHDECAHVLALEELAFEREPGPDDRRRPLLRSELPPIAGAYYPPEAVEPDLFRPRTVIVPHRFEGEPRIPSPRDDRGEG